MSWGTLASLTLAAIGVGEGGAVVAMRMKEMLHDLEQAFGSKEIAEIIGSMNRQKLILDQHADKYLQEGQPE